MYHSFSYFVQMWTNACVLVGFSTFVYIQIIMLQSYSILTNLNIVRENIKAFRFMISHRLNYEVFVANFQLSFKQLLKIDTFINGSKQKKIFFTSVICHPEVNTKHIMPIYSMWWSQCMVSSDLVVATAGLKIRRYT